MKSNVLNDLIESGSINLDTVKLFSKHTRDNPDLNVYIDTNSGVIFIKDFFVGHNEYQSGSYKNDSRNLDFNEYENYEDKQDSERRLTDFFNIFK